MVHEKISGSSNAVIMPNAPRLIRPRVDWGISQEAWLGSIAGRRHSKLCQTLAAKMQAYSFSKQV